MRELTEVEQAREVERIEGPWPMHSVLPMKNLYTSKIGMLLRWNGETIMRVYEGMWLTVEVADFEDLPKIVFESVAEMVKAGWVGD